LGLVIVWSLTRPSLPYVKLKVTILEFAYKSGRQFEENIRHSTVIASGISCTLQRIKVKCGLCTQLRLTYVTCGSVQFPSKRLGLQFVHIYLLVLLHISQALQFQTTFPLIHSIVHAIVDDTFSF